MLSYLANTYPLGLFANLRNALPLVICDLLLVKPIFLVICVLRSCKHVSLYLVICETRCPTWETHISSVMCSLTSETHIPSDLCSLTWKTHIPSDMCSQRSQHMFLFICVPLPAQHMCIVIRFSLPGKYISLLT